MSAQRDPDRERLLLRKASPLAPAWADHVCSRLAAGEREYGNTWTKRTIDELLREITEEAADIGAWAALAEQALDQHPELASDQRQAIRTGLLEAMRYGSWAWVRIAHTRRLLLAEIDRDKS